MGWFEGQIEERKAADQKLLENAFVKAAGVVLGERNAQKMRDESIIARDAIEEVMKYYHCKTDELPESLKTPEQQLDYSLRPHGIMRRAVELESGWYRDAFGPILAFTAGERLPVALIPGKLRGYSFKDPKTGQRTNVNLKNEALFEKEAICFYRPLPQKALKISDLLLYMKSCITMSDMIFVILMTFLVTLVGLVMPRIIQMLTGPVLASGKQSALIGIAISIVTVSLSSQLLSSVNNLATGRMNTKVSLGVEASMMMRLLSLPASFFRKYSPGELRSRSASISQLANMLVGLVMTTGLTSLTSLLYVTQIFRFAPMLVVPSVIIILVTEVFSIISTFVQIKLNRQQMELAAKESGLSYGMITGVQKLKLSGAEKRGFAKWLDAYSDGARLTYDPPMFIKINSVIMTAISLTGTIVMYFLAVKSGITPSDYFAFTTAYGMLMGAFTAVSGIALSAARIRPIMEMAEPFLKTVPETTDDKEIITSLSGKVELDHVSFRYDENSPYILNNLTLTFAPGEYIAIVGKTGCGKSTLVRLLLGFEQPEKGAIYYDGKDIGSINLPSLRRKIGTVMQDAGLFQGDIYSNIVITAPELTRSEAWEAAEMAGIADDIRAMPMGMHTLVSEGGGGISGGQRQRLMIARAIAPKPTLLIFDEATSALDNKTPKQVSEALDAMGCTRLVIAHRLSTIKHCDRILVLDGGRIVEDGTYDELIAQGGFFAELVERQRLDTAG
ncbi:MAG: NHLP bacteriocin export ABC transporter permease/ATPase subunit [Lachnospiraceae bacterium]|nr:NHLP bacteriocin export ABC transporter permease/ATPase subunit [Lachnospiraceae bacterium]